MKISVVIPLYNKEHYIAKTIESVLNQTHQDYELFIVDDGSTDNSFEVASAAAKGSNKAIIIRQANMGVAVARNTGIQQATGDYVAFLDADDYWHPDYLEEIVKLIGKYPESDFFVTSYRVVFGNGKTRCSSHLSDQTVLLNSYWKTFKNAYDIVWTSATVIRKDAIVKAGMFTPGEKIGQDLDLWARIARNNPLVAYSPRTCVDYKRNAENNARTRIKIPHPKAFLNVLKEEMQSERWSEEEKKCMRKKFNKKMIVYAFTTIAEGPKKNALEILKDWKKIDRNIFIYILYCLILLPQNVIRYIYAVRMKVF